ncbi:hypothetical protein GWL_41790 [Herbaspirillum sp. GW103]|nr:hypothetical protein GWL_41790 [Herbaspirillum sp. GW103]
MRAAHKVSFGVLENGGRRCLLRPPASGPVRHHDGSMAWKSKNSRLPAAHPMRNYQEQYKDCL